METVLPFRAWRYAPATGDPADLLAPPYDVIGPDLQSRLYSRSRYNVVRVDLGMTTPSDNDCDNRYTRAAAQLADWKDSGVLVRDSRPSLTFVEERYTGPDGRASTRHGFLAALRLHDFDADVVFPHEHTLSAPKEDRFRLMQATGMSLSPIFLLYDLPGDDITAAWAAGPGEQPPALTVTDDQGTSTKVWPTSDPDLLRAVGRHLQGARFVIADGHHRYETALRYKKHRDLEAGASDRGDRGDGQLGTDADETRPAFAYCLAYLGNMADPGLAIYGTHRLLRGLDPDKIAALPRSLAGTFAVDRLGSGPDAPVDGGGIGAAAASARTAIAGYLATHPRQAFGLWGPGLDAAYGIRLAEQAAVRTGAPDHSADYRELDVAVLHSLILENVLGITPADMAAETYVTFFKDPDEAFARLDAGDFQAGFFMNPTGLDQVRRVAFGGERMPQKATFFYPKLPTGLVFLDLSGSL